MYDQFSNMSFQNECLKGHMSFQVRKIISSTGLEDTDVDYSGALRHEARAAEHNG